MNCRGCGAKLTLTFLDLGMSPIANNLVEDKQLELFHLQIKFKNNIRLLSGEF